jgi:hypothetical protein
VISFTWIDLFWVKYPFTYCIEFFLKIVLGYIFAQILFIFLSAINPHIRNGIDSLLVPLLVLFVLSVFWRNSTATILSLAGVLCLYAGMFYTYDNLGLLQVAPSHIANRLGYGTRLTEPPLSAVADYYFFMGIFALILCTAVAFRPSIFRAKGAPVGLPYPLWTNDRDQNSDTAQLREKESGSLLGIPKVHDGFNIW